MSPRLLAFLALMAPLFVLTASNILDCHVCCSRAASHATALTPWPSAAMPPHWMQIVSTRALPSIAHCRASWRCGHCSRRTNIKYSNKTNNLYAQSTVSACMSWISGHTSMIAFRPCEIIFFKLIGKNCALERMTALLRGSSSRRRSSNSNNTTTTTTWWWWWWWGWWW